jgi:2-dehydropantoate 2-reductase
MKVAVYGTGAVGGYFGGRLAQAGIDVSFIARGTHLQAMLNQGLKVDSIKGDFVIHPVQASDNPADIGCVDLVIVCVKGWQVEAAAQAMQPLVGEGTLILPLLNGVDAVDVLSNYFGKNKVLNGLCGIFAKMKGAGHIEHIGSEPWLQFGEQNNQLSDRAQQVLALLQHTDGFKSKLLENITTAVWRKFIFIASTSGVGSVTRAKFGEVRANEYSRELLKAAIDEIVAVAIAHKVVLPSNVKELVWQQILNSADDSDTSMQRDVLSGKPSELDSQTGAVIKLAQKVGVATPVNQMIYACLLPQELKARAVN